MSKSLAPRRKKGRLPRLSNAQQRKFYGASWDDLPKPVAERIKRLFDQAGCMDLYDSPIEYLDVAAEILKRQNKQLLEVSARLAQIRKAIGD